MSTSSCPRIHKYVIATQSGAISEPFYEVGEAKAYLEELPLLAYPYWVAFHETDIQQLVDRPDTIESYCAIETNRVENPARVDFAKRS